ncbi:hypothetical protein ACE41A_02465 [Bacillus cytotoxicus]|uniref:hypothetical protein n=1 Tax=Bacillus cytotoxicus TaxID=580165 RepID=UPI0035CC8EF5
MEKLLGFLKDVRVNESIKNNLIVLIDNDDDLEYFFLKIFSFEKCFEEMIVEMRYYKLLEQTYMTESTFKNTYSNNEIDAISKLFRHYISEEDWDELKELMKRRKISYLDVYRKQMDNLEQNFICNVWQTII